MSDAPSKYSEWADEELLRQIAHEEKLKAGGYRPYEKDPRKRGFDPDTCDKIIAEMKEELRVREEHRRK